jgi:hypothetical protein
VNAVFYIFSEFSMEQYSAYIHTLGISLLPPIFFTFHGWFSFYIELRFLWRRGVGSTFFCRRTLSWMPECSFASCCHYRCCCCCCCCWQFSRLTFRRGDTRPALFYTFCFNFWRGQESVKRRHKNLFWISDKQIFSGTAFGLYELLVLFNVWHKPTLK